jgi:CTP:molybdopterin cytidylyltransferase MocA
MGQVKAYLPFRGGSFLSVLADTFQPFCETVLAVFGFDGPRLAAMAPAGLRTVINADYQLGMLTSLQAGLRHLQATGGFDRVLFTLVDHPAVASSTIASLLESRAPIAIPRTGGKRGHPVLIDAEIAREFLAEPRTAKVRDTIDRNAVAIEYVEVADTAIHDDIDDPVLYASLLAREAGAA